MRINNISQNLPSFGHRIILDIGASNPKGTLKVYAQSDDGRDIFKKKGYVNDTITGFENSQDFVNKIEEIVKEAHEEVLDRCEKGEIELSNEDKKLSGVAVFVPGTTYTDGKNDSIAFIPNLRDKENNSLLNVEFSEYEKILKSCSKKITGVDVNKDKFELIVTKDLGGCGLALSKILAEKDELHEGDYIMGVMTGGGFGSVDIKVDDGKVRIETSESSSYLTGNFSVYSKMVEEMKRIAEMSEKGEGAKAREEIDELAKNNYEKLSEIIPVAGKLGRQGVSVKSHINMFLQCLGREDLSPILIAAGDARIVEDNTMEVDKNDKDLIEEIKKHKEFEVVSDNSEKTVYKLREDVIGADKLKKARIDAVNDYANAVSLIVINKINDCLNKVVLVGPFAHGINRHIMENPEDFGVKNLPELIKQKVDKNIKTIDVPSSERLLKLYNLNIICDPEINIKDNTSAGDVLLDKKLRFTPNRGSWFSVPLKTLQSYCDKSKLKESKINNQKTALNNKLEEMEKQSPSTGAGKSEQAQGVGVAVS